MQFWMVLCLTAVGKNLSEQNASAVRRMNIGIGFFLSGLCRGEASKNCSPEGTAFGDPEIDEFLWRLPF